MSMNEKPLAPHKNLSTFFYENKLYEFSQKKLSEEDRQRMKLMMETSPEAKYGIGGVLLSLEYLEKLSKVSLLIKDEEYEALGKKTALQHAAQLLFFLLLTVLFSVSGYFIFNFFILGR